LLHVIYLNKLCNLKNTIIIDTTNVGIRETISKVLNKVIEDEF